MNRSITCALLVLPSSVALAHDGPRIWVDSAAGRLTTLTSDNDLSPTTYAPSQAFAGTLEPQFGLFTTEFPGFEARRSGSTLPMGMSASFDFAGPLLRLNTAGRLQDVHTWSGSPTPSMAVSLDSQLTFSGVGVKRGFEFFTYAGPGDHFHLSWTIVGDGVDPFSASPDGVYALPMLLRSPTLNRSDWFFVVLGKNATSGELSVALTEAGRMAQAIPGDANFSGTVDFADLLALARSYGAGSDRWWSTGDFTFDGAVGFDDLLLLAQNYNSANFAADWAAAQALVPEPAALGGIAGLALVSLKRRRGPCLN